jgi:hypothetical protein
MDQSKKTMRHFYCRDVLWETFEQMANDFDCSIDYLINEAMRYYARSKNYHSAQATGAEFKSVSPDVRAPTQGHARGGNDGMGYPQAGPSAANASRAPRPAPPPPPPRSPSPAPAMPSQGYSNPLQTGGATAGMPGVQPRRPMAPPAPRPTPETMPAQTNAPTLYLVFNNQRIPIDKDQFIIGRGSKTSDLAIKDGNISRKHAAVIRRNGTYYIKDLGSTNGIDYKGMRIDNKRIDEGDVFHLCDYELRFTYR